MSGQAPLVQEHNTAVPGVAAGTPSTDNLIEAPFGGAITEVTIEPAANVVGQATNFATIQVVNKGQNGLGNTVMASLAFSAATVTANRDTDTQVPVVAGATTVADDDVLDVQVIHTGTGLLMPALKARVTFSRA